MDTSDKQQQGGVLLTSLSATYAHRLQTANEIALWTSAPGPLFGATLFHSTFRRKCILTRRNQRKKTRFEIPRILAKYRRLAMHVKEMQPSVSVLDATDRERTQRIVASFIINLFKSLSESAQDFDSQQPFTRSPPFAPPLIRCARQGQAAAAARRLCAHVALVRSLT